MTRELVLQVGPKDFTLRWYSGSGAGGQHRNKHANCCEIKHKASGATGRGTESKERQTNRRVAFRRLHESPKFQAWLRIAMAEACGQPTAQERADRVMARTQDFKTEAPDGRGGWKEI